MARLVIALQNDAGTSTIASRIVPITNGNVTRVNAVLADRFGAELSNVQLFEAWAANVIEQLRNDVRQFERNNVSITDAF